MMNGDSISSQKPKISSQIFLKFPYFIFIFAIDIIWSRVFIVCHKLWVLHTVGTGTLITNMPSFYIALTCMLLGSQLFLAGFLGEMIARSNSERNTYNIKEQL